MQREDHAREHAATTLRRGLGTALIVLLASAAFLGSLVATLPARLVAGYAALPEEINGYSGSVWRGTARLPGGHSLDWRLDGARSLGMLAPAFAVRLSGRGSDLMALLAPQSLAARGIRVEDMRGRLAWPLVAALAPGLELDCDLAAEVGGIALALARGRRSGSGAFTAGPGRCRDAAGGSVTVPALEGQVETRGDALAAVLARSGAPEAPLAEAALTGSDRLVLTLHPAGAALVSGLPEGEVVLEYQLSGLPF